MKEIKITQFGITVTITYDPDKTTAAQLEMLKKDAKYTCTRLMNKRGY